EMKSIWLAAVILLIGITAIDYLPVFRGYIPFPAAIVFMYPPFVSAAPVGYPMTHSNMDDLANSFYPFHTLAARAVRDGSLPLWNPYLLAGTPFLANAQSALFYPPNYLYYILPVPIAWTIGFFLRPMLAGLFTVLLVRRIGGTNTGAIASA